MTTYEVCYNRGYDNDVCAMTYVEAKDFEEAYAFANAKRCGNERIFSIEVVKPIEEL